MRARVLRQAGHQPPRLYRRCRVRSARRGGGLRECQVGEAHLLIEPDVDRQEFSCTGHTECLVPGDGFALSVAEAAVRHRGAGFPRPPRAQFEPGSGLRPFVRRRVEHDEEAHTGRAGRCHHAVVPEEVFSADEGDVQAAQPEHRQPVAGCAAAGGVGSGTNGMPCLVYGEPSAVEDRGRQLAAPRRGRGTPTQVLRGAAGAYLPGEHDQVRSMGGGAPGHFDARGAVGGVEPGKGDA
ncbi:hypothetical protein [Streptomyces niger]|uniref:hypothetical protein n=1 Tax=Streptomyces niger TaxID=66373 RepID=UPI000699BFF5|nr:hypothetical protein [Streptomyces niger]